MEDQIWAAGSAWLGTICRPCIISPVYPLIGPGRVETEQWPINTSVKAV